MDAELKVTGGHGVGGSHPITRGKRFVLGRGRNASILLADTLVSRHHVAVELTRQGLLVTDLGSRNGTFLQGERIEAHVPKVAQNGHILQVGHHTFVIGLSTDAKPRKHYRPLDKDPRLLNLPSEEFEVLGEIGRGAVATVFSAYQKLLRRNVAVKIMRADVRDSKLRERFILEGRIACRIRHPNVVQVYDTRLVENLVYQIMELINGLSVKERLLDGPLDIAEVLKIAEDIAQGLEAVHNVGVIHRDVKPSNVLLTPTGLAKLSDFGLAKLDLEGMKSITATGIGLGTLKYVSPEQITDAKNVDHRTDIYSLGASLYEMIAGRPPFFPRDALIFTNIQSKAPPSLTDVRPDCPEGVADLIEQMLLKDPRQRPKSALVAAEKLRQLRERYYANYSGAPFGSEPTDPFGTASL